MNGSIVGLAGGSQPHSNIQPVLVVNYIIAITGIFPSRN
jgi:microcystin-dependent protein